MAWTGLALTAGGQNALNRAQLSGKMNIKSIVVGDGDTPQNFRTLKGLVNQLYEITELKIDVTDEGCVLTADFPEVDYDYYFREIGVIVSTDDGDKLYVYDNCGDDAQYIVNSTGVERVKKRMRLSLKISDVEEITVSNPGILYVAYDDYEKEIKTLHDTKVSSDGGDASGVTAGFVENDNLEPLKSGENLSGIFGRLAKAVSELISHIANKSNPHNVTKAQVGLGNVDNTSDADKPVSTLQDEAISASYQQSTGYTDKKISDLINGAPTTLDTLGEIAKAMSDNQDVVGALNAAIGTKASQAELDGHTGNTTLHLTAAEKNKLSGIETGAQKNTVTGIKGNAESSYRTGNVNITPANIGLGNVNNTADENKRVSYASSAGNADAVDWVHFHPGDNSGAPNGFGYVYGFTGGNDYHTYVWATSKMSVNYATSSGNADTLDGYHYDNLPYIHWGGSGDIQGISNSGAWMDLVYCGENRASIFANSSSDTTLTLRNNVGGRIELLSDNGVHCKGKSWDGYIPVYASAFNTQSSRKYKKNIRDITEERARELLRYRVVTYDYIGETDGTDCMGLIAEEVAEIEKYPVSRNDKGEPEGLDYSKFVPQLIRMVQLQQEEIDRLKTDIRKLQEGGTNS